MKQRYLFVLVSTILFAARARAQPVPDVSSWAGAPDFTQSVWAFGYGDPRQADPSTVADELQKQPAGNRVLLILGAATIRPAQPSDFLAFGLDDYAGRKYYAALFKTLRGTRLDFVALDEEWGHTNWDLFAGELDQAVDLATDLYTDPFVRANMPAQVSAIPPASFRAGAWFLPGNVPVQTWNAWTWQLRHNALDRLVYAQARAAGFVEYGNYDDCRYRFGVEDVNGWPGASLVGVSRSCPHLYLNCGNAVNSARGFRKHPLWNNLIRTINLARSCAAAGPTRAWISYPAYSGDNGRQYPVEKMRLVWSEQVRHVAPLNVKVIYWNPVTPDKPVDDDAYAAGVFRANPVRRAIKASDMVPINYDADEIRTGTIVTRYVDLERALNQ